MKNISRRQAMTLTGATIVAGATMPAQAKDTSELRVFIAKHKAAFEADSKIWDQVPECTLPCPKAKVGVLLKGKDIQGNDIKEPMWRYSENSIRELLEERRNSDLSFYEPMYSKAGKIECANWEIRKNAVNEKYDRIIAKRLKEYRNLKEQRDIAREENGYTNAFNKARQASKVVKAIEADIINYNLTSMAVVALWTQWILSNYENDTAYFDWDDPLQFALTRLSKINFNQEAA